MRLPLQPEGLTLTCVSRDEARAAAKEGQTVIVGDGLCFTLKGAERAVKSYGRSCLRFGWALVAQRRT